MYNFVVDLSVQGKLGKEEGEMVRFFERPRYSNAGGKSLMHKSIKSIAEWMDKCLRHRGRYRMLASKMEEEDSILSG